MVEFQDIKKSVIGSINSIDNYDDLIKILEAQLLWVRENKDYFLFLNSKNNRR